MSLYDSVTPTNGRGRRSAVAFYYRLIRPGCQTCIICVAALACSLWALLNIDVIAQLRSCSRSSCSISTDWMTSSHTFSALYSKPWEQTLSSLFFYFKHLSPSLDISCLNFNISAEALVPPLKGDALEKARCVVEKLASDHLSLLPDMRDIVNSAQHSPRLRLAARIPAQRPS
jgi:hypothetical protein